MVILSITESLLAHSLPSLLAVSKCAYVATPAKRTHRTQIEESIISSIVTKLLVMKKPRNAGRIRGFFMQFEGGFLFESAYRTKERIRRNPNLRARIPARIATPAPATAGTPVVVDPRLVDREVTTEVISTAMIFCDPF